LKRSLLSQIPVFIAARTVINTSVRMVYPFLPAFGRGLGVDLRTLSLAVTLRSTSGVMGPILASIADSQGRKMGMIIGLSLLIAGSGIMVVWPSLPVFFLSLMLCVMANLTFIPSMQAYLGDRIPYQRRGLVLALTEFSWSLSFIAGIPLVGLLLARNGWQAPFPWFTGLGLLSLVFLGVLLPRENPETSGKVDLWCNIRSVFSHPSSQAGILFGVLLSFSNELINLIFGVWLEDAFMVKISTLAAASTIIGLSELSGETLVSVFVDRLGKHRAVRIGLVLNGLAAIGIPILGRELAEALLGLFLLYSTFEFTIVSSITIMSEVLPAARATFMAAFVASTALGRALGDLLAPTLYHLRSPFIDLPGIFMVGLATAILDLIALVVLRAVKIPRT
jgi:predicted MFS family arabinose efflux permease